MADEGSHEWTSYIPDNVPPDRCGYTIDYEGRIGLPNNVTCWRETSDNHNRCIWHVDVAAKSTDEFIQMRSNWPERLDHAVLRGIDFEDTVDFANCTLVAADLTDADFNGANFSESNLRKIDLGGTDIYQADLSNTTLFMADLTHADLEGTTLIGADLRLANLTDTDLFVADLTDANLDGADLTDAILAQADLTNVILVDATITDAFLPDATLTDANLTNATAIDAIFAGATITNASLRDSNFANSDFEVADLTDSDLEGANLIDADLHETTLTRTNLEDAILENADLDGADLTDARLHNCRLQDVYISDETTFGDRCIYEKEVREAIETDGLTEDQIEPIEKAISIYRTYQRLLRENSLPGDIPHYFYREKEMRRLKARAEGNHLEWGYRELQKWVMGYGERPWRVVGTSLLVMLVFAGLYPLAGGVELETDVAGPEFLTYLYFSGVTFTTLGYGDVHPLTQAAQQLAVVQSFLGAALMALLVAVLTRRAMR